jgi:hypothetical protein
MTLTLPPEVVAAAGRGWRLHPLRPKSKEPALREWQLRASSDLRQLETWAQKFPECNWGAVAGSGSGFFAVDVDDPAAMQKLEDEYGAIPEGLCIVTSRGYALIYQWPNDAEVRPATKRPCDGIDIRGLNSYIVIPPSVHPSGARYHYTDPTLPISPCPAWLMALILNRSQNAPTANTVASGLIPKGGRTNWLVSLAGTMHKRRMDPGAIEQALLAENTARCSPPLHVGKVKRIAHDIPSRYPNATPEAGEKPRLRPDLLCLANVAPRTVEWLWQPYIPARMLSMLSGDPGAGKSYLALAVAAELSRGRLQDGRSVEPASTLYLTCENPIAECIRPRFDLLGGDPHRLHILPGTIFEADGEQQRGTVSLSDVEVLEEAILETGARLVIVDPIQSYFGAHVDLHRSNETRPVLDRLAKLAETLGCSFLFLRHLSKQSGGKAIHRGLGSIDLTGAVRSEMLAGSLPDDPEARALVHVKSNVGPYGRTLGFRIDKEGRFSWTGDSTITASDLLAAPTGTEERSAKADAEAFLKEALSEGSVDQQEIRHRAEIAGIAWGTLRRAKTSLNVRSNKTAVRGGWIWALPDVVQDAREDARTDKVSTFAKMSTIEGAQPSSKVLNLTSLDPEDAQNPLCEHAGGHLRQSRRAEVEANSFPVSSWDSDCGGLLQ